MSFPLIPPHGWGKKIKGLEMGKEIRGGIKSIPGYLSCVQIGRGSEEINQLSCLAGAVTLKPPLSIKKAVLRHSGLDTATISGLSDQGTEHGGSVLQCLGNTLHYLVSFF